jgi:lysophospholipase L1-like esterase
MRKIRLSLSVALAAVVATVIAVPAFAAPGAQAVNYVALGDSYASGTGAGDYGDSGNCLRSANAYPNLWANANSPAAFTFAACSGAVTSDVLNSQVNSLSSSTTMVTISIGGNDAGFVDVITDCTLGSDQDCINRVEEAKTFARNTLPGRLNNVYAAIKSRAPSAEVYVLGYPRLYMVPGNCSVGLSNTKRSAINDGANTLAEVTAGRVAAAGFNFVDARPAFAGHEICTSDRWLNSLTWPITDSYHPNKRGHALGYLAALNSAVG